MDINPSHEAPSSPSLVDRDLALLSLAVDWLWEMDASFRVTRIQELNPERPAPAAREVIGKTPWECSALNMTEAAWESHRQNLRAHRVFRGLEIQRRAPDGRVYWSQISGAPRFDADRTFIGYHGVAVDVTDRKQAERSLQDAQAELDATLRAIPDVMFEVDRDGRYLNIHAPRPDLVAGPLDQIIGRTLRDMLPPDVAAVCEHALNIADREGQSYSHRYALQVPAGLRWFELSVARKQTSAHEKARFIALVRDITDLKETEARLQDLAFYDALTGLPNRRLLLDRIDQAVARMAREQEHAALLFLDLDGFKQINDLHGHPAGDEVLQLLGERLRGLVRESDPLGRLSGDEFLVMLQTLGASPEQAQETAARVGQQIVQALREPFILANGTPIHLSVSVGALLLRGQHPVQELLASADALMYRAKAAGKDRLIVERLATD